MRHGFHQACIRMESVTDQLLAIAGYGTAANLHPIAAQVPQLQQLLPYQCHRIALVGGIIGIQDALIFPDQCQLGGGAAAVNTQPSLAAVGR